MKRINKIALTGLSFAVLMCADFNPQSVHAIGFVPQASAIVGRPATPVSYAGVARRHVAVAPVATAAVVAPVATAAVVAPVATAAVVAPVATAVAIGTVAYALPAGCATTKVVNGASYYYCGGTYYKASYQGNNLVYVVSAP